MKVAIVHDYLNEYGGAERVLEALCEIFPKAPIYTAFYRKESVAYKRFKNRDIRASWAQDVPFFARFLHSPLRFLAPKIWNSFVRQLADYDVVITSASWYVTKGIKKGSKTIEICYCHTPPRYLYGYKTSRDFKKNPLIRAYALVVNHYMRVYDFEAAQKVDYFIANSKEVAGRIKKFYRRGSKVIYPPVDIRKFLGSVSNTDDYFLVVSRLSEEKNVDLVVEVCKNLKLPLKVVGTGRDEERLTGLAKGSAVEVLGAVSDSELVGLYQNCRAVIFAASQEDFGIVPVEAMAAGKPVIALAEGGVLETVIDATGAGKGKGTGVYFDPATAGSLTLAINNFVDLEKKGYFDAKFIKNHAQKFSKERFKREILKFVESKI